MVSRDLIHSLILFSFIHYIGCYTFNRIEQENTRVIKDNDTVKITTVDGIIHILSNVTVDSSEIRGTTVLNHSDWLRDNEEQEIVILCKDIQSVEVKEYDHLLSGIAIGLGVGILAFLAGAVIIGLGLKHMK